MGLIGKITEMLYELEGRLGKKPIAIYLGRLTKQALYAECEAFQLCPGQSKLRPEFNGVPIFTVDDDNHLNVG